MCASARSLNRFLSLAHPVESVLRRRSRVDKANVSILRCILYSVMIYLPTRDIRPWFPAVAGFSCADVNEPSIKSGISFPLFKNIPPQANLTRLRNGGPFCGAYSGTSWATPANHSANGSYDVLKATGSLNHNDKTVPLAFCDHGKIAGLSCKSYPGH